LLSLARRQTIPVRTGKGRKPIRLSSSKKQNSAPARAALRRATVDAAAAKAHISLHTLTQARSDLGVISSRGNAGGVQAVQWSLPG
jgi:hypothetical protein